MSATVAQDCHYAVATDAQRQADALRPLDSGRFAFDDAASASAGVQANEQERRRSEEVRHATFCTHAAVRRLTATPRTRAPVQRFRTKGTYSIYLTFRKNIPPK
jgi:hypothetical protein